MKEALGAAMLANLVIAATPFTAWAQTSESDASSDSGGDEIIPALLRYLNRFHARGLPVYLTRDWHPPNHCSFRSQGGQWPVHCVAGSPGSLPPPSLVIPTSAVIIYKAIDPDQEAYSAFQNTALNRHLHALGVLFGHVDRLRGFRGAGGAAHGMGAFYNQQRGSGH